jgi:FtsH-binding integral membrane protein
MPLCEHYYGKVFAHLAGAFGIASLSAEFLNTNAIHVSKSPLINTLLMFGLCILTLVGIIKAPPYTVLKYVCFALFAVCMGQSVKPYVKKLEDNHRLVRVLTTTMGIFIAMTALGFYDNQNILGFYPYLFVGLLGLLIVNVIWFFTARTIAEFKQISYYMDIFGTILFTIYISYHTQVVKENARSCETQLRRGVLPDYPRDSAGLFLDVVNLFSSLARSNN